MSGTNPVPMNLATIKLVRMPPQLGLPGADLQTHAQTLTDQLPTDTRYFKDMLRGVARQSPDQIIRFLNEAPRSQQTARLDQLSLGLQWLEAGGTTFANQRAFAQPLRFFGQVLQIDNHTLLPEEEKLQGQVDAFLLWQVHLRADWHRALGLAESAQTQGHLEAALAAYAEAYNKFNNLYLTNMIAYCQRNNDPDAIKGRAEINAIFTTVVQPLRLQILGAILAKSKELRLVNFYPVILAEIEQELRTQNVSAQDKQAIVGYADACTKLISNLTVPISKALFVEIKASGIPLSCEPNDDVVVLSQANINDIFTYPNMPREVRAEIWREWQSAIAKNHDVFGAAFVARRKLYRKIAKDCGFEDVESYVGSTQYNHRTVTSEQTTTFIQQHKPRLIAQVQEERAKLAAELGLNPKDLKPWDHPHHVRTATTQRASVPLAGQAPEAILQLFIDIFTKIHPEFGSLIRDMIAAGRFDFSPREGKKTGGVNFGFMRENDFTQPPLPFIITNLTPETLGTIFLALGAHELTHAEHAFRRAKANQAALDQLNKGHRREIAETFALLGETMALYHLPDGMKDQVQKDYHRHSVFELAHCMLMVEYEKWLYTADDINLAQSIQKYNELMAEYGLAGTGGESHTDLRFMTLSPNLSNPFEAKDYLFARMFASAMSEKYEDLVKKGEHHQWAEKVLMPMLERGSQDSLEDFWKAFGLPFLQ